MARSDIHYVGSRNQVHCAIAGGEFVGNLYRRSEGGIDLYFSMTRSDLSALDANQVTLLRRQIDDAKEAFVTHLASSRLNPFVYVHARRALREWLQTTCALRYSFGDRVRELAWLLADVLGPTMWP